MTNIQNRINNLEKKTKAEFISIVLNRLDLFDDKSLLKLFKTVRLEAEKRNLFLPPEIQAGRGLYEDLLAKGLTENESLQHVLESAKRLGYNLRESDILGTNQ